MTGDPLDTPLWPGARRLVLFVLGVAVIIDAVIAPGDQLGNLVVGVLLVGLVPVDEMLGRILPSRRRARAVVLPSAGGDSEGGLTD